MPHNGCWSLQHSNVTICTEKQPILCKWHCLPAIVVANPSWVTKSNKTQNSRTFHHISPFSMVFMQQWLLQSVNISVD